MLVLVLEIEELFDGDVFIFVVWLVVFINCLMLMVLVFEDGYLSVWEIDVILVKYLLFD